jgi:hypothetical protein
MHLMQHPIQQCGFGPSALHCRAPASRMAPAAIPVLTLPSHTAHQGHGIIANLYVHD